MWNMLMSYKDKEKRKAYVKAYMKAYEYKDKEKRKAYLKAYLKAYEKTRKPRDRRDRKAYQKNYQKTYHTAYRLTHQEQANARRRKYDALKIGNGHKPYTDAYIYERDGWICGICRLKIDKRLKRPNLLSKSIDHIIPISKGGADAPINLQATHLICNIGKRNKSGGQLRLIG